MIDTGGVSGGGGGQGESAGCPALGTSWRGILWASGERLRMQSGPGRGAIPDGGFQGGSIVLVKHLFI